MTNEQAKKMIKAKLECLKRETSGTDFDCNNSNCDECSLCYEQGNMEEQKEALEMAIKALEQQPCEDTISRQDAIDALIEWYGCEPSVIGAFEDIIEKMPSAQPEEVTPHRNYQYLSDYWCECGWHLGKMGDVNYCPNCGKKVKWDV